MKKENLSITLFAWSTDETAGPIKVPKVCNNGRCFSFQPCDTVLVAYKCYGRFKARSQQFLVKYISKQ